MLFHGLSLLALLPLAIAKTSKYNTDYKSQEAKIAMVSCTYLSHLTAQRFLLIPTLVAIGQVRYAGFDQN